MSGESRDRIQQPAACFESDDCRAHGSRPRANNYMRGIPPALGYSIIPFCWESSFLQASQYKQSLFARNLSISHVQAQRRRRAHQGFVAAVGWRECARSVCSTQESTHIFHLVSTWNFLHRMPTAPALQTAPGRRPMLLFCESASSFRTTPRVFSLLEPVPSTSIFNFFTYKQISFPFQDNQDYTNSWP